MSHDIEDVPNPQLGSGRCCWSFGCAGGCPGGLVVAVGVDGEVAEEFAGGGVDDADVEVFDEEEDVGSGVGSPDSVDRAGWRTFVRCVLKSSLRWNASSRK